MKKQSIVFTIAVAALMSSCAGNADKNTNEDNKSESKVDEKTAEVCIFKYKEGSATVSWTAFKTTEKVGVEGEFNEVNVNADEGEGFASLLESISFEIQTASTNTNDAGRDEKIVESFFGAMANSGVINGKANGVNGDDESGEIVFALSMNEVTKDVSLKYVLENDIVTLEGGINMMDFNGSDAVESLNEACHDLHKGADGVSKTWNEVDIKIAAKINKDCN